MKLSVLVLNYKTKILTECCLRSVLTSIGNDDVEIYVADNCSADGSAEYLQQAFSSERNVYFIANEQNLGFAKGNNELAKLASGQFLLFLNSDTIISDKDAILEVLKAMEEDESIGIGACRLLNEDGSTQVSCARLPRIRDIMGVYLFGRNTNHYEEMLTTATVETVIGAFMIMRRDVFLNVGMFDEDYFFNTEDVDLCYRVLRAGLKINYYPTHAIIHLGGQSQGGISWINNKHLHSSIVKYFEKTRGRLQAALVRLIISGGLFARRLKHTLLKT